MDERKKQVTGLTVAQIDGDYVKHVTFRRGEKVQHKPDTHTIIGSNDGKLFGISDERPWEGVVEIDWRIIEHVTKPVDEAPTKNEVTISEEEETPACVTERRFGCMEVSVELWREGAEKLIRLLELRDVSVNEWEFKNRGFLIVYAYSPHFETRQEGTQIPFYNPTLSRDENGEPILVTVGKPYYE
ncbi:MAG: hypothetical protein QM703_22775 [Gemmatales bacterium]